MKRQNSTHALSHTRKLAIIEAALSLFSKKGFTETSMSDICQAADASTGSVYHHFKSKEQLAAAVYIEGIGEYQRGIMDALVREEDARAGIRAIISFHLTWVKEHPLWARFLFHQRHASFMDSTDDALNTLNKTFAETMGGWFKKQVHRGTIRPRNWDLVIVIILGPCQEFSRLYLSGKSVSSVDEAIEFLTETAWLSLAVST
ncbi:MAG: TetR/AcrR family transcriptional regulator [Spirochaetes bacterium]|nr:TetR/AcrR family transcriptional regulator [Spirochaetota bacterium]